MVSKIYMQQNLKIPSFYHLWCYILYNDKKKYSVLMVCLVLNPEVNTWTFLQVSLQKTAII